MLGVRHLLRLFLVTSFIALLFPARCVFEEKKCKVKKQNKKKQGTLMCIPYNVVMIAPVNSIDCQSDL